MNKENYQIIREIAYNLPNPDRDIIMLYLGFYYGKSYNKNEIADMLSISQSTVSKLIGKNLKIIKKHLIKEGLIKEEIKNINEIRKYLEEHPGITYYTKINDRMQTTGSMIGSYLQEYKEEIIEISKENSDAKYVCDYFGWLEKKVTIEDILKEIKKYLEEHHGITYFSRIDYKMQTTGGKIGNYLRAHKEEIINMSDENSEAKYIYDYFDWLEKKVTIEDVLKEIRGYLEEHPGITNFEKIDYKIQTTGGKIGNYLFYKKEEIINISNENSDAKYICDYFGWNITKEDNLKEIRNYLEEHSGITSYTKIEDRMQTTGGKIGKYLSRNKEKIKEISNENSDAKYICDYFGWNITKEDILEEIREYLEEHPGIRSYVKIEDRMKTTGGKIGNYLSFHKEEIINISDENSDAKYICDYFKWIVVNDELNVDYNYSDDQIIKDNLKIKMMNKK